MTKARRARWGSAWFGCAVVGSMLMGGACGGRGYSRDGLRDAYVDKVVDSGVDRIVAECIIDRLFGEMTDDQLKVFNIEGSALSAEQTKRVVQLAGACGA